MSEKAKPTRPERPAPIPTEDERQGDRGIGEDLLDSPITLTFGGKKWEVKPLPWKRMNEWRSESLAAYIREQNEAQKTPESLVEYGQKRALAAIAEVVFSYIGDLPQELQDAATEYDLHRAFNKITDYVMRPFV